MGKQVIGCRVQGARNTVKAGKPFPLITNLLSLITVLVVWSASRQGGMHATTESLHSKNGAPDTMWTKTFGGTDYDRGESVQQTTDGGYIITYNVSFEEVIEYVY